VNSHIRDSKSYGLLKDDVAIIKAQHYRDFLYRDFLWASLDKKCTCKSKFIASKTESCHREKELREKQKAATEPFEADSDNEAECLEVEDDGRASGFTADEIRARVLKSNRFQNFKRMLKYKAYHEYNLGLADQFGECMLRILEQQSSLAPRDLNVHFHGRRGNSGKSELAATIVDVVSQATEWGEDFFILRISNSSFGTSSMRDTQIYKILSWNDISNRCCSGSLVKSLLEWDFSPIEVKFGQV